MFKQLISVVIVLAAFLSCLDALYISCQPRTRRELETKLQTFGGYNKRYQAITKQDADKFPSLINQKHAVPAANNSIKKLFRRRRQDSSYPQTNDVSFSRRGSQDPENSLYYLCSERSAVTTLSADYFPRHLNEVICDTTDTFCLQGNQGECVQGKFSLDVLKKTGECEADGKEKWDVVSQEVRSSCNCRSFIKL